MIAVIFAIVVVLILVLWHVNRQKTVYDNIFFDNNGTTQPHKAVVQEMASNAYLGNASSSYAWKAKKKLDDLRNAVLTWCRADHHKVIITSGASESNNMIIRSLVDYHWRATPTGKSIGEKPHIILSSIEHKTSLDCASLLREAGRVDVSLIEPDIYGNIDPKKIQAAINNRTILVSIMSANNEIGNKLPVEAIAAVCKARNVPFHTDAVQTFGKYAPNMQNISALSMSFHKMNGPQGIGVLVLDNDLAGKIAGQIAGSQNYHLRGGTENIPAVAGAIKAMEISLKGREDKNKKLLEMKHRIIENLSKAFIMTPYEKFAGKSDEDAKAIAATPVNLSVVRNYKKRAPKRLVILGPTQNGMPDDNLTNPNTLLLSVMNTRNNAAPYEKFCNIKFKSDLATDHVIVSIGSACQTGEKGSSHVLKAIQAPFIIRCGVVRISLGDYNTMAQVDSFCKKFINDAWLQG